MSQYASTSVAGCSRWGSSMMICISNAREFWYRSCTTMHSSLFGLAFRDHHVAQNLRDHIIRRRTRHRMPVPVAVYGQRVDGVDPVTGREQRLDQKTALGLDSDHD